MKPIILKNWHQLIAALWEDIFTTDVDIILSYAQSWDSLTEQNWFVNLNSTDDTTILDNGTSDNFVVADVNFYNNDDVAHTIYLRVNNWSEVFQIWRLTLDHWESATLDSLWVSSSSVSSTDEKTKVSSDDTNSDYLENKLVAWDNIGITTNNPWNAETLSISLLSHTHTSADITDFTEAAQDAVWSSLTNSDTVSFVYDDSANTITANAVDNSTTQKIVVDKDWTSVWTRKEINFIAWDNVSLTISDDDSNDRVNVQIDSTSSWWIGIAPVTKYDWGLTNWVFEQQLVPNDITLNTVKNYLEQLPTSSTSTTTDADASAGDTTISVSSVDWFEVWDNIKVWTEDHTVSSIDTYNKNITIWEALSNDQASWATVDRYGRIHINIEKYDNSNSTWITISSVDFYENDTLTNTVDVKDVTVWTDLVENDVLRFNITEVWDEVSGSNLKIYFK